MSWQFLRSLTCQQVHAMRMWHMADKFFPLPPGCTCEWWLVNGRP